MMPETVMVFVLALVVGPGIWVIGAIAEDRALDRICRENEVDQ